jgi:phage tail protein X
VVERILDANPGISVSEIFQAGVSITLPEITQVTLERSLW